MLTLLSSLLLATSLISSDDLLDPSLRGSVVTTEGVVRDATRAKDGTLVLDVRRRAASFAVVLAEEADRVRGRTLPDATVRVTGELDQRADGQGAVVRLAHRDDLVIVTPAPTDPFSAPLVDFDSLDESEEPLPAHRVHFRGTVGFTGEDYFLCKLDADRSIRVWTCRANDMPKVGDRIDGAGFVENVGTRPSVEKGIVRVLGHDPTRLAPPKPYTLGDVQSLAQHAGEEGVDDIFAQPVVVEGRVVESYLGRARHSVTAAPSKGAGEVVLAADNATLPVLGAQAEIGARVRATGYVLFEREGRDVRVMLASPEDLVTLERAPFWTPGKFWTLIAALVAGALALVFLVRKHEQTKAEATTHERMRLSSDLHDGLQQLLASARFRLDAAKSLFDEEPSASREQIAAAGKALLATQAGLRAILWGLQEESEGPNTLIGLFRYAASRLGHWKGIVEIRQEGEEPDWARKKGGALLMVLQEAVGNALVHGHATRIAATLVFPNAETLKLRVSDNGCGFDTRGERAAGHLGLRTMAQRAEELKGSVKIISTPGVGTTVILEARK